MHLSQQINLAASPAAAQLLNRAQNVNSAAASGIAQQAVLLGNTSSPALTASQAQMYLRAQMVSTQPGPQLTGPGGQRQGSWELGDWRRVGIRDRWARRPGGQLAGNKERNKEGGLEG